MMSDDERGSTVDDSDLVSPKAVLGADEIGRLEARSALLQHDRVVELAEACFRQEKAFRLRPSMLLGLQAIAVRD